MTCVKKDGIRLVRIKEYDWDNNSTIKQKIINILNEMS